jgi:hypothetical protein
MVLPPLVLNMVIYVVLPDISDVLEAEPTPRDDAVETGPRIETSAGEFFFSNLTLVVQVVVAEVMVPLTLGRLFRGGC